ncbi:hypothetical protein L6164_036457 [Bauhinia variegata]|uniref:Uncharacterized protein n=1 Tax=Bauhinia variegata TaxID=167791 RepID=A0ACB9KH36_BAUVA|nr:hypothetical protein L6164_036457 [Bauhinia variegata]
MVSNGNSGDENCAEINWDEVGFSIIPTDFIYLMKCPKGNEFLEGKLVPYGNIELSPSAAIINYGQGVIEGLKAHRTPDEHIVLFRPEENARRMKISAERMCMPSPSTEQFVEAVKQTVLANKRWVPPTGKGSLYIRPLLMGTGSVLGLAPATEYTFLIYTCPVKSYHKGPLNLVVKDKLYRAINGSGGTGGIKSATNYSPTYKAVNEARAKGFSDILYLDAETGKHIEEVSACNIFIVKGSAISTPPAEGTILPGITRKSIMDIAIDLGYQVMERPVPLEELLEADEVFCTGTAVVVNPAISVTYNNTRREYKTGADSVSQKLYEMLVGIQTASVEDTKGWNLQKNPKFTVMSPLSVLATCEPGSNSAAVESYAKINWDELGFGLVPTDFMYVMKCAKGDEFSHGGLARYGNIELNPSAGILNYGQGIFEGLKAYRTEHGQILLFRPEENAQRMKIGAERMCMPSPSVEQFVNAVKQTVLANKHWVPPPGKGSLYIRPLLMGTGAVLGLAPASEYTFLIYASPVKSYHKGPLNLIIEDKLYRAVSGCGGTGGVKSVTNYAPIYRAINEAKAKGFSDVLFLDAATGKYIEEISACNVFVVKGNAISTPAAIGTILPGITRKSIIEIALDLGYQVEERPVSVEEVINADEVFCTGTAMVVNPVLSVTYNETKAEYKTGVGTVSQILYETLVGIQTGRIVDTKGWSLQLD